MRSYINLRGGFIHKNNLSHLIHGRGYPGVHKKNVGSVSYEGVMKSMKNLHIHEHSKSHKIKPLKFHL